MFGSFAVTHGDLRPALMNPSSTDTGVNFDVITDLDLAALVDIGWQLNPVLNFRIDLPGDDSVVISWNSVSFKNYQLEKATLLPAFSGFTGGDGDGTTQSVNDMIDASGKSFYRLSVTDILEVQASSAIGDSTSEHKIAADATLSTDSEAPRMVDCSVCSGAF